MVYVVRNPKDVLISYYNFFKKFKDDEFIGTLDDMVDLFVEGNTVFGSYWDHLNQYENLENVHIIHYEDLIEVGDFKYSEERQILVKQKYIFEKFIRSQ